MAEEETAMDERLGTVIIPLVQWQYELRATYQGAGVDPVSGQMIHERLDFGRDMRPYGKWIKLMKREEMPPYKQPLGTYMVEALLDMTSVAISDEMKQLADKQPGPEWRMDYDTADRLLYLVDQLRKITCSIADALDRDGDCPVNTYLLRCGFTRTIDDLLDLRRELRDEETTDEEDEEEA